MEMFIALLFDHFGNPLLGIAAILAGFWLPWPIWPIVAGAVAGVAVELLAVATTPGWGIRVEALLSAAMVGVFYACAVRLAADEVRRANQRKS